ncbi:MAG: glycosyltransferase family 4 protein [Candidatus Atribacteria bacterium]|nr:glycosyltransferase family 4 protein [Candidatus Atribacteria bacterium]
MEKKFIFICGNFGYKSHQVDGQTVKTRQFKEILSEKLGSDRVVFTDTSYARSKPIMILKEMITHTRQCSHFFILPGRNGLRFFLPFYIQWKKILGIDVRYIVIGGWLDRFLKKKKYYLNLCKQLNGIYVETNGMKEKLTGMGLDNVYILPNFRKIGFEIERVNKVEKPLKVVYFSRVIKEKGIELAIEAVEEINKDEKMIQFDIYGPIEHNYEKVFYDQLSNARNDISYRGIIEPVNHQIYLQLSQYDLMIFPTYYPGEGFPGAIVDSLISGVPVLASDWNYNAEIIEDNKTGKLFVSQDLRDLIVQLKFLLKNTDLINEMKKNCLEAAKKYQADVVIGELLKNLSLE